MIPIFHRLNRVCQVNYCLIFASYFIVTILSLTANAQEQLPDSLWTRTVGQDWPEFLGPNRDSKSSERKLNLNWTKSLPKQVYTISLGEGYGMPSVYRGRLFMFDRIADKMRLTCYNAQTAEVLWRYQYTTDFEDLLNYSNGPRAQPVCDGSRVYVIGSEGILSCLEISTGKLLWKVDTDEQFGVVDNFFGVGSTPIVYKNLLIANIGGSPPGESPDVYAARGIVKSNNTGIVAFDKHTGKIAYKTGKDFASYTSPVIKNMHGQDRAYVFARNNLISFDPASGKIYFQFPWKAESLESVNASTPIVIDDHIFISETYGPGAAMLKITPDRYKVVWSDKDKRERTMQAHWNTPIYLNGYIYGCSGRHSGGADIRCVNAKTGEVMWTQTRTTRCSMTYVNGYLISLSEFGRIMIIKPDHEKFNLVSQHVPETDAGDELFEYPAWAAPVVSHGYLWLRGKNRLVCYDISVPNE